MSNEIVIQIHLGQNAGPDADGYVTPPELFWNRGDQVQAYLPEDVPPSGNIMRTGFAYVENNNEEVFDQLTQRKQSGERMPTETVGTRYGPQGEVLERSKVKYNLAALSANRRKLVDDEKKDSPIMPETELPIRGT